MKKTVGIALIALMASVACQATEKEKLKIDRGALRGYVKQYDGCTAAWIEATQSLSLSGEGCGKLSLDKVMDDAAVAYLELKKKGVYANFDEQSAQGNAPELRYSEQEASLAAIAIWKSGCSDFKDGMNAGDFRGRLRPGDAEEAHPGIKKIAVTRLYMDGWKVAHGLGGVVNCAEMARYRSADFISGIDIRK
ncbi:TPA: hypothetical protein ACKP22_002475 [Pseudomonas putida]